VSEITNLAATEEDVTIRRGASWVETWTITDQAGDPVDLSTAEVLLQVRKKQEPEGELVFAADNDAITGITIGGADNNEITISKVVDGDDGTWFWDLKITHTSGRVDYPRAGTILIHNNVSV
jgi:hypothetical protein